MCKSRKTESRLVVARGLGKGRTGAGGGEWGSRGGGACLLAMGFSFGLIKCFGS